MQAAPPLHEVLVLYTTPEKYYITPANNSEVLLIDRVTENVSLEAFASQLPSSAPKREIYGILGCARLVAGLYLVVVTSRTRMGKLHGQDIYRLSSWELLPFHRTTTHLSDPQVPLDKEYIGLLETALSMPYYYFSYTHDLSHSAQRLVFTDPTFIQTPLYVRADTRFVWNYHLLEEFNLKNSNLGQYSLPLILGFVSINWCQLNGRTFSYALVSRRSRMRAGTRLFTRGIDSNGNVANFVETEQIVETSTDLASFIQTRGSIPLYWSQWPSLKLKPQPQLEDSENQQDAFIKHFNSQIKIYGKQVIVNLINHTGSEGKLENYLKQMTEAVGNPDIKYEGFDFHKECSKMRYERLSLLNDRLAHYQQAHSLLLRINNSHTASSQEGVFRTNCIDCLDRTNVVQSMLAKNSLTFVLQKLGILREDEKVEGASGLESLFRATWADHADAISNQYAGSAALKTDFTRTGKRSIAGQLQDLTNTLLRYYRNNFRHGYTQDSLDLFLGNYIVKPGEGVTVPSPLNVQKGWKYLIFPMILLVAIAMFFANLTSPPEYTTGSLLSLLFWASMVGLTLTTILYYGAEFVDCPRLNPLMPPPPNTPLP